MSLHIEENVDLRPLNTLGISATASYLIHLTDATQIPEATQFAAAKTLPLIPWGGGSNVVIGESNLDAVILKNEITGRTIDAHENYTDVTVGAGENWDELVAWSVSQNLHGMESLSLIPGTVGAAPVQNVGAYGQEVSETITEVQAYNLQSSSMTTIANSDCQFTYRDSIFKHTNEYIITSVTFRLSHSDHAEVPTYASLQAELVRRAITTPTVADIREAVIAVRQSKLPDPAVTPTVGSFFHNPIINPESFQHLQEQHTDIPHWPTTDGHIKLSGAWLIEECGFKGHIEDGVGVFDKQALCIINPGHKPAEDVLNFRDEIIAKVQDKFGVSLKMEPELITLN